jgi:putative phage-type endonuclease
MEQRSDAWFDARKGLMTCSRMGEAVGLIGSRRRLWRELTGRERGQQANSRMTDGINCEQIAVALYEQVMGVPVHPAGFLTTLDYDWLGGSPDGLVTLEADTVAASLGGLEVKCPTKPYGRVPDYYMPQMQGLMAITQRTWWDFMVWTPDHYAITRVQWSPEYWQELYVLLCEFWAYVEADIEPPVFARGTKPRIRADVRTRLLHKEP